MLNLIWSATLKDGTYIKQFDDEQQTKEHLFKEVQERLSEVAQFTLLNIKSGRVYEVDLLYGRISIYDSLRGDDMLSEPETKGTVDHQYRLIYFRRVTHEMSIFTNGQTVQELKPPIYFLGYQYTTRDDKNVKRLVQISDDDQIHFI